MTLPVPNLDDRHFQDLVDEAKRRIPRYCPTWTDHNVSDPGITLIELFAWMTEQYLYRLNQIPDKNFVTFLDLIGVRLSPARAARGDVTFNLSTAANPARRTIIPAGVEVATERTETEEAVVFTTDKEVEVLPGTVSWVLTGDRGPNYEDKTVGLKNNVPTEIWANPPRPPQALYIGFEQDLDAHVVVLQLECDRVGIGINPEKPPWRWEAWRGNQFGWEQIEVGSDTTAGFNQQGEIKLFLPYRCQPNRLNNREALAWVRCLPETNLPRGETPYARSPRIRSISAYTIGITAPVTHAQYVSEEVLGVSNGQPGQKFRLQHTNVLRLEGADEVVEVANEKGKGWQAWQAVSDFGDSKSGDPHYTLDPVSGLIEFGPAVRQPNGTEPQFGAIPPQGRQIRVRRYRIGGGVEGNVAEHRLKVLKTTLPYVAGVSNRYALTGGEDAETLEAAKLRGPTLLRTRHRAVTAEDYEALSSEIEGVGRVRCLQAAAEEGLQLTPGTVYLLVIPSRPPLEGEELNRHITLHDLLPRQETRASVEAELQSRLRLPPSTTERLRTFLDARRLLTTRISVNEPRYVWVAVEARVKVLPKAEGERVRRDVKTALYRYLDPLYGGPDGTGWPFGRPVTIDKIYSLIQQVPGVDYATELKLYPIDISDPQGERLGRNVEIVDVPPQSVVVSYFHNVYLAR